MDKDDFSPARKYEVWAAWEVSSMQPKTIAQPMRDLSYRDFRLGILAANPPHQSRASFFADDVHLADLCCA